MLLSSLHQRFLAQNVILWIPLCFKHHHLCISFQYPSVSTIFHLRNLPFTYFFLKFLPFFLLLHFLCCSSLEFYNHVLLSTVELDGIVNVTSRHMSNLSRFSEGSSFSSPLCQESFLFPCTSCAVNIIAVLPGCPSLHKGQSAFLL